MTDIVGLIPAAGRGKRIAPLPCSKELYPIGFRPDEHGDLRPEVASAHLLDKFRREFEPVTELADGEHVPVLTTLPASTQVRVVRDTLAS